MRDQRAAIGFPPRGPSAGPRRRRAGSQPLPFGIMNEDMATETSHFRRLLYRNRTLVTVLGRAAAMDLPDWYLVAARPSTVTSVRFRYSSRRK